MFPNNESSFPTIENREVIFDEFIKIRKDSLRYAHRITHQYYTMETPADAVALIALTPCGEYILNLEYRHPVGKTLLSCPGGYLEGNEDPFQCAERELLEETGYSAPRFSLLGTVPPLPGICSQMIYYVLAEGAIHAAAPTLEPTEILKTTRMNEAELKSYIAQGNPIDGTLCTALALFLLKRNDKSDCAEQ